MMHTTLRTAAITIAAALFTIGCGGGQTGPTTVTPTPTATLMSLLPAESPIVLHVNVASVRSSDYFATARTALRSILEGNDAEEFDAFMAMVDETDVVAMGVNPVGASRTWLLGMRGSYSAETLQRLDPPGSPVMHRNHSLLGGETDTAGVNVDNALIMFGATDEVRAALDRHDGLAAATGPQVRGYEEAARRVGMGVRDFSIVYLATDETRRHMGQGDIEDLLRENLLSMGGSLHLENGITGEGFLTTNSADAANVFSQAIQAGIEEAGQDATLASFGLGMLISNLEIEQRGEDVVASIHLDDAEVRQLLDQIRPFLALLGAM